MKLMNFDYVAGVPLYRDEKGAVLYKSGCSVNADGAPHAYAPDDSGLTSLDYLGNAGSTGNWWGIATDPSGVPYIQAAWDPAPGFYISTTALCNDDYAENHPLRYVDSERYAFGVIPGGKDYAKLGDVGLALNLATGDHMYYALADVGPKDHLGEGSILLSRCLGLNPHPKSGGTSKRIIAWMILPNSDPGYTDWGSKCRMAMDLVEEWGGLERLKTLSADLQ